MEPFHQRNKFLIYLAALSTLYSKSLEKLISNKSALLFFKFWSMMPLLVIPIYIASDIKYILFDGASAQEFQGLIRRNLAFLSFLLKSLFYLTTQKRLKELCDLWDSSFKENFYPEQRKAIFDKVHKETKMMVIISFFLMASPGVTYGLPPFFSKTKKLAHPTGFPFREQSPDYEAMITYDLLRVIIGCCSSAAADCFLMVLLSLEQAQMEHLYHCLKNMVGIFATDSEGNFLIRQEIYSKDFESLQRRKPDQQTGRFISKIFQIKSGKENLPIRKKQIYVGFHLAIYKNSMNQFENDLRIWIRHHQEAIRYFEALRALFMPLASIQMIYVVFYTCFTAFQLVAFKTTMMEVLTISVVATSNLISLFVWSRICDNFDRTGHGLFGGAFGRHWFLYPRKVRNAFYFISMRCQRPLVIKGLNLFPMVSMTFFEIIKLAYQLFAFLRHIYSKK